MGPGRHGRQWCAGHAGGALELIVFLRAEGRRPEGLRVFRCRRPVSGGRRIPCPEVASSAAAVMLQCAASQCRPGGRHLENGEDPVKLMVRGIPTAQVRELRAGGPDAHGQPPLRRTARGMANPCRHCLQLIPDGAPKLVLAYRPFEALQPYAEVGPIFLHEGDCPRYESDVLPAWFAFLSPAVIRGYGADHWIRYETGAVVTGSELTSACQEILSNPGVAYVHIRSKFNCFQCQVERG